MTDAVLTKKQAMALLRELTSNDGFRRRFMEKPAAAMLEVGIPAETIVNLSAKCLAPAPKLAANPDLKSAHDTLAADGEHETLTMWIPSSN